MRQLLVLSVCICTWATEVNTAKSLCQQQVDKLEVLVRCFVCLYESDWDITNEEWGTCISTEADDEPNGKCAHGVQYSWWPQTSTPTIWARYFAEKYKAYPSGWFYGMFGKVGDGGIYQTPYAVNLHTGLSRPQVSVLGDWAVDWDTNHSVIEKTYWGDFIKWDGVDHLDKCINTETDNMRDDIALPLLMRASKSFMESSGANVFAVWTDEDVEKLEETVLYQAELVALSEFASKYAHYPMHLVLNDMRVKNKGYTEAPFPHSGNPADANITCSPIQTKVLQRLHELTTDKGVYLSALRWTVGCQGCEDVNGIRLDSNTDQAYYDVCFNNIFPEAMTI